MKIVVLAISLLLAFAANQAKAKDLEPCVTEECVNYFNKFQRAARRGFISAEYNLAKFYYYGYGTDKNETQALKYYRKAAVNGAKEAQYMAGLLYITNEILKDFEQGAYWLERASLNGHIHAAFLLGKSYVLAADKPNFPHADLWLTVAFDKQYHKVPNLIEQLSQKGVFNEDNFPMLYNRLVEKNMWVVDGQLSNWDGKTYERITVTGSSLQTGFDTLLASFRGRNSSTGSRIAGDCYRTGACQRKTLNEMKDSMWVSQN